MLCLLLVGNKKKKRGEKKKKKEEKLSGGVFFPRAGHTLLAVLHGFFTAVRCNYRLI
jgi:hypothetical protein